MVATEASVNSMRSLEVEENLELSQTEARELGLCPLLNQHCLWAAPAVDITLGKVVLCS